MPPLVNRGARSGLLADHRRPPLRSHKDLVLGPLQRLGGDGLRAVQAGLDGCLSKPKPHHTCDQNSDVSRFQRVHSAPRTYSTCRFEAIVEMTPTKGTPEEQTQQYWIGPAVTKHTCRVEHDNLPLSLEFLAFPALLGTHAGR